MDAPLFPDLVIDGETVPHAVVAAEAQNHEAPAGKPGVAWRKAANALAVRTLLLNEARRRKIVPEPAGDGPGRRETEDEAMVRVLLEAAVVVEPPSADDIHAEWARDPSRFRAPPLWEVSHILIACDPHDQAATAKAWMRAADLAKDALTDPDGFARLAAAHSDCGSKSSGGALGQIGPGDTVPEFEAALRRLSDGEITPDPVLSRHGWHVIRMDSAAEGAVLPFDTARRYISEAMEKVIWARGARAFVAELAADAEISGADLGGCQNGTRGNDRPNA